MYSVFLLIALSITLIQYAQPTLLCFVCLFVACGSAYPALHLHLCKTPTYRTLSFEKKM